MLEFFNIQHPKAKKEHVCDMCGQKILPGKIYERYSGKYEGEMFDCKYCLDCETVINAYCEEVENEYSEDAINDWLSDEFCHDCKHGTNSADDCTFSMFHCPVILEELKW